MTEAVELSLVVPCYREEGHLAESIGRIAAVLRGHGIAFEVVFVEDCSPDGTREVVRALAARDPRYRAIYHDRNRGRGAAVRTGATAARGAIVGFVDIDLEVDASYIPPMVAAIRAGADVATGNRRIRLSPRPYHLLRHAMSLGYRVLYRALLRIPTRDPETGFKFFRRERLLQLLPHASHDGWFWDTQVMAYAALLGMRVDEIPCEFVRRADKQSTLRVVESTVGQTRELVRFAARLRQERRALQRRKTATA
jgi:glycosyltransferase involved in cell wall biosynthesis